MSVLLEREVVVVRTAGVRALLKIARQLESVGVDRSLIAFELHKLCQDQEEDISRIARCAATDFHRA